MPEDRAYKGPEPSGPGIFLSMSKIIKTDVLSPELFEKWYNEVHCPDVIKTGKITKAYRFKNKDPQADRPYCAVYVCPDMAAIASEEIKGIPMTHPMLPDNANIHDIANFDTRFYSLFQEYETSKQEPDVMFPLMQFAGMQCKDKEDLDKWYRQEHLEQMSKEPGFRRAKRFNIIFQAPNALAPEAADHLTLYEMDEDNKVGNHVEPVNPQTQWTKKVCGPDNLQRLETHVWEMIKEFS